MKEEGIKVLLVDDDEDDYILVREMLSQFPSSLYDLEWAESYEAAFRSLERRSCDVCLLDYFLGDRNGLDFLQEAVAMGCRFPIIFLTGYGNYDIDLKAMKMGASDYLVKGQLNPPILERSIRYAIERRQSEEELREHREHLERLVEERTLQHMEARADAERRAAEAEEGRRILQALMDYVPEGIAIADASDCTIRAVSDYALRLQQRLYVDEVRNPRDPRQWIMYRSDGKTRLGAEEQPLLRAIETGEIIVDEELVLGHPDGDQVPALCNAGPVLDKDGNITGGVIAWRDISTLKAARTVLQKAHDELERRVEERTNELVSAMESLNKSEKQLRFLSARLLKAQEEERRRIARELHDSIGSALSAIKLSLESTLVQMKKGKSRQGSILALIHMTQEAIDESRRLMTDLRPSILDDLGIVVTLRWFCRQCRQVYSNIGISEEIRIEEPDVPQHLKIVIFRIIQEALNNVAKYSRADLADVSLVKTDHHIELKVEDNGIGFDLEALNSKDENTRGLGLTSMRERAELSGGSFRIVSALGKGTAITAWWPHGE